jgi:dTDP-4-amino-4,6-dideoxygalactose transaminase
LAAQSFHETKNFTCGEGGALLINDPRYIEQAEIVREKGTNRSLFFRGEVDKYTWIGLGSSYLPSDILAAFLYAQLEARENVLKRRKRIWDAYASGLSDWAAANDVQLPAVPAHCEQAHHMFYIVLPSKKARTLLIDHLKNQGILSVFHYLPLHLAPMGKKYGYCPGDFPVTEAISDRLLRLPFYNDLTPDEQLQVIEQIQNLSF